MCHGQLKVLECQANACWPMETHLTPDLLFHVSPQPKLRPLRLKMVETC